MRVASKMKLGIVNPESWAFMEDVLAEFSEHHQTSIFRPRSFRPPILGARIDRYLLRRDLTQFLRSNDVVFFEWASERLAAASRLPKFSGMVVRLHRYELYQWADNVQWDAVDRLILVSEAKRTEFIARFPSVSDKIEVIPEAISPMSFPLRRKQFSGDLGILCHLSPRKRVYDLILAFDELIRAGGDFQLHIGGGPHSRYPEYLPVLRSLVERLGLEKKVRFYGPVQDPADWYRRIDIFISNSYSEGLQVSPMEAIAAGCYCLSHHWDGAGELLPSDQLFYSERELIEKIRLYAAMVPEAREQLQADLRERVLARFDARQVAPQIRRVVEEVAALRSGYPGG